MPISLQKLSCKASLRRTECKMLKLQKLSKMSTTGCASLWIIFIILQLSMPCVTNAHQKDHDEYHRTNFLESTNNADAALPFEATDDITRGNIHLYALGGHHFNRSLIQAIKNFDSDLVSNQQMIKVHFPPRQLPDSEWMIYNDEGTIQGVPLPQHTGLHNFYITILDSEPGTSNTLPCIVEVINKDSLAHTQRRHHHAKLHDEVDTPRRCPHNEPVTIAGVELEVPAEGMNRVERVECVSTIEKRFGVLSKDVTFTSSTEMKSRKHPILSGLGNAAKIRNHRGDRSVASVVSISWVLGCSSDMIGDIPILEKLEMSSFDGSLARALGYDVIGWFITNSVPKRSRQKRYRRRASEVDDAMALDGDELDGQGDSVDPPKKRNRVPTESIKSTPYPQISIKTVPLNNDPMDRTYASPSTPDVRPPKTEDMPMDFLGNSAPMVLFGMSDVKASMDTYMEYEIPNSVFFDLEDDMSYDMDMKLHDEDSNEVVQDDNTWLKYDTKSHIMYGVPDHTAVAKRGLVLVVTDSGGKTASCSFVLHVHLTPVDKNDTSHKFTFVFSESPEVTSDNALYASFGRKLVGALEKTEQMPGDLIMSQTGNNKNGLRFVEWFDSSMTGTTWCKADDIRNAATVMVGAEAMEGRNKPNKEFERKFRPEFRLKTIIVRFFGPCKNFITTTTPTTTTTTTTATTTSTTTTSSTLPPPSVQTKPTSDIVLIPDTTMSSESVEKVTGKGPKNMTTPNPIGIIQEKQFPEIVINTGIPSRLVIPSGILDDISPAAKPKVSLLSSETWIAFDSDSMTLYLMPTSDEVLHLPEHNSSYKMWEGGLAVTDTAAAKVGLLKLKILIKRETPRAKKPNHKFVVVLKDYNLKTFRASDRMRLVRLIADIFEDPGGEEHIYLEPLEQGSVVVTWYNTTLGLTQPCPAEDIAKLGRAIFVQGKHIQPSVIRRFRDANFTFTDFKLKRTDFCPQVVTTSTEKSPDLNAAGPQGNTTTIVIIIVIIVCLVVIIAILVIKCRKAAVARKNKQISKGQGTQIETATTATTNPDLQDTARIKRGVPIIFQDEIGMETSGNTSASATTPLMSKRSNGGAPKPDIQEGNLYVSESTPFTTPTLTPSHPVSPPTPMMSNRPPPPYSKSR